MPAQYELTHEFYNNLRELGKHYYLSTVGIRTDSFTEGTWIGTPWKTSKIREWLNTNITLDDEENNNEDALDMDTEEIDKYLLSLQKS